MNIIRPLLVCAVGLFLTLPLESYAANRKIIIGFHRTPELHEHNVVYGAKGRVRRNHRQISALAVEVPEEEIARLKNDLSVAYVVDDVRVQPVKAIQTLAPSSSEYTDSWGVVKIGAETAVNRGFKGAGVKVGIIDSGIDYNHPDLKDNYMGGYNFVDNNSDPYDDDLISHGTHVAGIIAAKDNSTGVVGVAPAASLYAIKVFGANGSGGDLSTIIAGIEWAINNGMNVVNLSIGLDSIMAPVLQPLRDVCDLAYQKGIVLVAAAGNESRERVSIPAAYDSVIAVSATDQNNQRAVFIDPRNPNIPLSSNIGPEIELTAPGLDIKSTVRGGGYALLSGTSQSAPHVAGAVAVVLSAGIKDANGDGHLTDEVRQRLASTAVDLGTTGRDTIFGWGLVDLAAATAQPETHLVHLVRTEGRPKNNAVSVQLTKGFYNVSLVNNGLHKVVVRTSDSDGMKDDTDLVHVFKKKHRLDTSIEVNIDRDETTMEFVPFGRDGSSAEITITKLTQQAEKK